MAELGLDSRQNDIIKQSDFIAKRIAKAETIMAKTFERYIKVHRNISNRRTMSPNDRAVQRSIDQLNNILPIFKSVYAALMSVATDSDIETAENNDELIASIEDTLKSSNFRDMMRKFDDDTQTWISVKKAGHITGREGEKEAENLIRDMQNTLKKIKSFITTLKQYVRDKKGARRTWLQQKKRNIAHKLGIDEHDDKVTRRKKLGGIALRGAGIVAAAFLKSPGVAVATGALYLNHKKKVEKARELHKKKINAVYKVNNDIKKAIGDAKLKDKFDKQKFSLSADGYLAGGGKYRARRNATVVVGDNKGGKERVAISGSNPFTTKGATLLNLRAGQSISASPIGSRSGVTRVNKGALSRFAGGTDVESDKEQISNPQAISNPIVSAIKAQTALLAMNAKEQFARMDDAANKDKGIGASKFGAGVGLLKKKEDPAAGGSGGFMSTLLGSYLSRFLPAGGLAGGLAKLATSRAGLMGAGVLGAGAGAYGGWKIAKGIGNSAFGVNDAEEAADRAANGGELSNEYKIRKGLATGTGVAGAGVGGYGGYKAGQWALGKAGAWGASKVASGAATGASTASKIAPMLGTVGKVLGRVAGPLAGVVGAVSEFTDEKNKDDSFGTKAGKAAFAGGGAMAGTAIGATLGSVVPVFGTAIGGMLGGYLGSKAGSWLGGKAFGKKKATGLDGVAVAKDGSALVTVTNAKDFAKAQSDVRKEDYSGDKGGIEGFFDKLANSDNPLLKALGFGGGLAAGAARTVSTGVSGAIESYRQARSGGGGYISSATAALKGGYQAVTGKAKERESILEKAAIASGMTDPKELAMFMGQAKHETAGFGTMREFASGKAYEGRRDLGNTQAGDGERYKGRGYFQLTGRANYADMSKKIGVDLLSNPELAEDPQVAAKIALQYWKDKGLDKASRAGDFDTVTRRINGGTNGYADRLRQTQGYNTKYAQATTDKAGLPAAVAGSIPAGETPATMAMTPEQRFAAGLPPLQAAVQYAEAKSPAGNVPIPKASAPSKTATAQGEIRVAQAQSKAATQEKAARERAVQESIMKSANNQANLQINSNSVAGGGKTKTRVTTGDDSMIALYNFQLGMV